MDILAHALWTTAAGIAGRKKLKKPIHLGWLAAWGLCPDLIVFTVPATVRIWRFLSGASKTLLPDGRSPRFEWFGELYKATHSAVVFAVCFGALWILLRRPVLEMLGWIIHITMDVFTHSGWFAVNFLWPVSPVHVDGKRWEQPWFLAANYAALVSFYVWLWLQRRQSKFTTAMRSTRR